MFEIYENKILLVKKRSCFFKSLSNNIFLFCTRVLFKENKFILEIMIDNLQFTRLPK